MGATVAFSLVLTNAGPDPATNVVVSDTLPATLRFMSSVPSLSVGADNIVQWPAATTPLEIAWQTDQVFPKTSLGGVEPGQSGFTTYAVKASGRFVNYVLASPASAPAQR